MFAGLEVVKAIWDGTPNRYDADDIRANGVIVGGDRFIWTIDRLGEELMAKLTMELNTFHGNAKRFNGSIPVSECTTPANIVAQFRWDA